jgi:hypothetical protein
LSEGEAVRFTDCLPSEDEVIVLPYQIGRQRIAGEKLWVVWFEPIVDPL